ncbi:MAG TPA: hypothetical protein VLG46_16195 [Anaerolineae bacterium]|nr:hypothetical protein [Anaerolineales bacterium]HSD85405.1 hypothetical protein [Anaerolineae bacterium]
MQNITHYIPILTTVISFAFTVVLYRHWQRKPEVKYLMWWTIGVFCFGIGTLTEAINALFGWSVINMKAWYIAGALLGAFPLAQGTVYLLLKKKTADLLAWFFIVYIAMAAIAIMLAPVDLSLVDPARLTGKVMTWTWARLFSILPNTYALIFLVGGAAWSAIQYARKSDSGNRVLGNWLIAIGALLPGIGGSFTRMGYVEVLFVTEFIGILLIWAGYRVITQTQTKSIHAAQAAN